MPDMPDILDVLTSKALDGQPLNNDDLTALLKLAQNDPTRLRQAADAIKQAHFGPAMALCAIVNAKSGRCPEDCGFCAQSAHHQADAPEFGFIGTAGVLDAARQAKNAGVRRFGVVISGTRPRDSEFNAILDAVRGLRAMGLEADGSLGILTTAQLAALKDAGLTRVHHNLETARSFFPAICTTHDYEDDVATVRQALAMGLRVCSGGLFGLGESWEQRAELALALRELGVDSVPINFLTPIPGTRFEHRPRLSPDEALAIVAVYRFILPTAHLRVCGGREAILGSRRAEVLTSGASGIMVGNYLTTAGSPLAGDLEDLEKLGLVAE